MNNQHSSPSPWSPSIHPLRAAALLLGLGLFLGGCTKADTVVLVHVVDASGQLANKVFQLDASVTIGDPATPTNTVNRQIFIPASTAIKGVLVFPTTFTIEVDRSHTGTLVLDVNALDVSGAEIAQAPEVTLALDVGARNEVTVTFGASTPDAGMDGSDLDSNPDSAGGTGGVTAGTGGATGSGGATGAGGSTGTGGAIGVGGATGSGGATGVGGMTGTGGAVGTGGMTGTGGVTGTGGATGTGGMTGTGGVTGTGGMTGTGGDVDAGGANDDAEADAPATD